LKVRSPGPAHNKTIEALGGTPLSMPIGEMYDALDRGVANATITAPSVLSTYKLAGIIRYSAVANFTVANFFLVMNAERWHALSVEDQRTLDAATGERLALQAARVGDQTDRTAMASARSKGVEFFDLPADELARWRAAAGSVSEQWAADVEARGLPARRLLERRAQLAQG
jgi:TRAP-type C4-dicarboxylate transport system substrate-binding protein